MPDWVFIPALGLYYDPESGRYVGPEDLQSTAFESIDLGKNAVVGMADALIDGTIDLGDWQESMRQEIMDEYTRQYLAGVGGEAAMRDRDWDRLNALITEQYAYLDAFAESIGNGDLTAGQIEMRAQMYIDSAQQAYWAGVQSAREMPELPAVPGDGSTRCMCITTPEVPVLTRRGWVPMLDVQVGDAVWTHCARWRPVTAVLAKAARDVASVPQIEAVLSVKGGLSVGCTASHLWYGPQGWRDAISIDSFVFPLYNVPIQQEVRDGIESVLQDVWYTFGQPESIGTVYGMSPGMSLRQLERSTSGRVYLMRNEPQGQTAMGHRARQNDGRNHAGRPRTAAWIRRVRLLFLAAKGGWALLQLVLGRIRPQAHSVPLSVGVDNEPRTYPAGPRSASQERRPRRRPAGKPRVADQSCSPQVARGPESPPQFAPDAGANMSTLRPGVQAEAVWRNANPQVLFRRVLPRSAAVFDLTVAEDHSFVIGGLVAHNTNCRCHWEIEETAEGWSCVWRTDPAAEHCSDCVDRENDWNPLVLRAE